MPISVPVPDKAAGDVFTELMWDSYIRDNINKLLDRGHRYLTAAQFAALVGLEDGDEVYLEHDAANGIYWHLRYKASLGDNNKWVCLGGAPASVEVDTAESRNNVAYGDLATVHSLTLARPGVYELEYGMTAETDPGENNSQFLSPKYSAAEAVDADAVRVTTGGDATLPAMSASRRRKLTIAAAGQVVTMRAKQGTAHASSPIQYRWLKITPVRIASV